MPHDVGGWLSVILSVVAIASAAGLTLMRANQTTLREQNNDLRSQIGDADAEVARIKAARAEDQAEATKKQAKADSLIAQLEADNAALQRVVTGEVHWVALGQRLEDAIALLTAIKNYVTGRPKDGA